ncbi:MAG: glutamine-hydrolyzing carbamoyl-phosphate synthase small subunit [Lachnospiraceae bacterium]|nr:glutamine-hydrolyzing carbamoyl-phosphate synthase small subunit [Lachnospiraceae bacterium]
MAGRQKARIITEDGEVFTGSFFGAEEEKVLELVFNTSMVGYQEILSDPSYTDQAVVMTYPLIGNYGMARDDYETRHPSVGAMIVHEYNDEPSNFRSERTLGDVMKEFGITGVCGIDTRSLNRMIRDRGSKRALITGRDDVSIAEACEVIRSRAVPNDAVSRVSCREIREFVPAKEAFHVVAIDCGMKENIARSLVKRACRVSIVPWNTSYESIRAMRPDGLFISNGPGDPRDVEPTINTVRKFLGEIPVFGICLGHQIISLAYGADIYKLKFGHRGGNHPVKDIATGKIEITSQNHSYAVNEDSLKNTPLTVERINILDNTVEGVGCGRDRAFSVQYHPESAPGPRDSAFLFDRFLKEMEK